MKILRKKGMSLMEIVITAGLFVILASLMVVMIVRGLNSYQNSKETIDAQDKAAHAMRDFEKTARGATEILVSDPDELDFYAYMVGDQQPAPSQIRYFVENNQLVKGVIHPSGSGPTFIYPSQDEFRQMVVSDLTNGSSLFTYYNDVSNQITAPVPPDAVRMIKLTVSIDKNIQKPPSAITEITSVNLRNLKTNL